MTIKTALQATNEALKIARSIVWNTLLISLMVGSVLALTECSTKQYEQTQTTKAKK